MSVCVCVCVSEFLCIRIRAFLHKCIFVVWCGVVWCGVVCIRRYVPPIVRVCACKSHRGASMFIFTLTLSYLGMLFSFYGLWLQY